MSALLFLLRGGSVLSAALLVAGCAGGHFQRGQTVVGTLDVVGSAVRVDGKPAVNGQPFRSGQNLSTGPVSTVYLQFPSGGYIQLDENTDPVFTLVWDDAGHCFIDAFQGLQGQAYQLTNPECRTRFTLMGVSWTHQGEAQFNLRVSGGSAELTVLEGKLVTTGPKRQEFGEGYRITLGRAGIQSVRLLSPEQIRALLQWQAPFPPPCGG